MDSGVLAETLAHLSWREALVAIIALLVLYFVVVLWRMRRLRRVRTVLSEVSPIAAQAAAVAAYAAEQEPTLQPAAAAKSAVPEFAWNEPPPEIPGQQMIDALERHVYQLRSEVSTLRAELAQVREEMQREVSQSQATQNISPLYSDAMQMALQGHDAATIAEHCGIARGEAELVVALVRNRADAR